MAYRFHGSSGKTRYAITIVSHVEPMDIGRIYTDTGNCMQYDSAAFREIRDRFAAATTKEA